MKKILLILLMSIFVASCTLTGGTDKKPTKKIEDTGPNGQTEVSVKAGDFSSLYSAYLTAQVNETKNALNIAKIFSPQKSKGDMSLSAEAGPLGKVSASADIMAHAHGMTSKVIFSNVDFNLESMMAGTIEAKGKEIGFIQTLAGNYLMAKGIEIPEPYASQIAAFKEYEGKWIQLPNASTEQTEIMKQMASLTSQEINDFITKYPVLKAKGEAKIDGTKNTFGVELNADNILALRKALTKRFAIEDAMTNEDEAEYKTKIEEANKNFNATLTFDTKNHLYLDAQVAVMEDGENEGNIVLKSDKDTFFVEVAPTKEKGKVTIDVKKNEAGNTTVDVVTDIDEEKTNTRVEVGVTDDVLTLLKMTFESSDVNVNINYSYKDDAFNGKFVVSADGESLDLSFDGKTKDAVVQNFNLAGTGPEGIKIMLETKDPKENMMHGTFALEVADQGKMTGNIGLALGKEIFGLSLDSLKVEAKEENPQIAQAQQMLNTFKFSFLARGTNEETTEKVEIPTDFVKFEEIMKKVAPPKAEMNDMDTEILQEGDVKVDGDSISVQGDESNVKIDGDSISVQNDGKNIKIDAETVSVSQ